MDALQQLAGLYEIQASEAQERAAAAEAASQAVLFQQDLEGGSGKLGEPLFGSPIASTLREESTAAATTALTQMQEAYGKEAEVYSRLTVLLPDDATVYFELGRTSQLSGDVEAAISAYERFLEISPNDANASIIREQLRLLRAQGGSTQ